MTGCSVCYSEDTLQVYSITNFCHSCMWIRIQNNVPSNTHTHTHTHVFTQQDLSTGQSCERWVPAPIQTDPDSLTDPNSTPLGFRTLVLPGDDSGLPGPCLRVFYDNPTRINNIWIPVRETHNIRDTLNLFFAHKFSVGYSFKLRVLFLDCVCMNVLWATLYYWVFYGAKFWQYGCYWITVQWAMIQTLRVIVEGCSMKVLTYVLLEGAKTLLKVHWTQGTNMETKHKMQPCQRSSCSVTIHTGPGNETRKSRSRGVA